MRWLESERPSIQYWGAIASYPIYDDFSKGSHDFQVKNGFILGNYPLRCFFEITGYSSC